MQPFIGLTTWTFIPTATSQETENDHEAESKDSRWFGAYGYLFQIHKVPAARTGCDKNGKIGS